MTRTLRASAERWSTLERIVLYDELHAILTRSVCEWAGVPLPEEDVTKRAQQLCAMFDRAGAVGPPHWWSRHARNRAERWIAEIIALEFFVTGVSYRLPEQDLGIDRTRLPALPRSRLILSDVRLL